jgi:hypothetical protein
MKEIVAKNVEIKDGRITGTFVIRAGCAQSSINPLWVFDGNNPIELDLDFNLDPTALATNAIKGIWIDIQADLRKIPDAEKISRLMDHTTLEAFDKALIALVPVGKRGKSMAELRAQLSEKDRQIAELEAKIAAMLAAQK